MDNNRKELYKQIYKEKKEEYDRVFGKRYRWTMGILLGVSTLIIDLLDLENNIYAYVVAVTILGIFAWCWEKNAKK